MITRYVNNAMSYKGD